mmetsp:Transcript_17704/g.52654  ORF Transcript_17704/g.52654 Transcript_17704/m.52654 type:complete len:151 (-) Transcript_17704:90-542(-)
MARLLTAIVALALVADAEDALNENGLRGKDFGNDGPQYLPGNDLLIPKPPKVNIPELPEGLPDRPRLPRTPTPKPTYPWKIPEIVKPPLGPFDVPEDKLRPGPIELPAPRPTHKPTPAPTTCFEGARAGIRPYSDCVRRRLRGSAYWAAA